MLFMHISLELKSLVFLLTSAVIQRNLFSHNLLPASYFFIFLSCFEFISEVFYKQHFCCTSLPLSSSPQAGPFFDDPRFLSFSAPSFNVFFTAARSFQSVFKYPPLVHLTFLPHFPIIQGALRITCIAY